MRRNYDRTTPDPRSVLHDLYSNTSTFAPPVTATSTPVFPNVTVPDFAATITPVVNTSNLMAILDRSVAHLTDSYRGPAVSPRTSVLFSPRSSSVAPTLPTSSERAEINPRPEPTIPVPAAPVVTGEFGI